MDINLKDNKQITLQLLFDMDGVILDNNAYHKTSWMEYSRRLGYPLDENSFKEKVYGKTNEGILDALLGPDALTIAEKLAHAEAKEALFREMYLPHFQIASGLIELLEIVRKNGATTAVATNAPKSNLDFSLATGNIAHLFDAAVWAHLVGKPKPAPDLYLKAAELINAHPQQCIVFEDSLTGIQAAKAAGAKVVAITTTYSKEELSPSSDLVINSFTELNEETLRNLIQDRF